MSEVTSAIPHAAGRRVVLRRAVLTCTAGPEAGRTWEFEQDVIRIGALASGDVVLSDPTVSRRHAEIVRTREGILLRDLGSTNGTFCGPMRIREVFLGPDTRFRVGRTEFVFTPRDEVVDVQPSAEHHFEGLVGDSLAMREVFSVLDRVAPTDLTVLIAGETGTGKELASRAIHRRSRRAAGPFVVFDCGAVPENLVESELFGHRRGAFTGAVDSRPGVFEQAHGGTIFLDEVGELPLELQPKLLRVLEQREVRRLGDTRTRSVDVRVVAATNVRLREAVEQGRFREDLYYRLAVVEVVLPPLRQRLEDLPSLARHLLARAEHNPGVTRISPEVMAILQSYHWPGNVREFANVIERALPFCEGDTITLDALPESLQGAGRAAPPPGAPPPAAPGVGNLPFKDAKDRIIEAFERQYLRDLLARFDGNVSRAARAADMDRKSITRLMKKHGITRPT